MPTAVITGASSGIGRETAFLLASHGYQLVLAARHRAPLDHVHNELDKRFEKVVVRCQPTDVGVPDQVERLICNAEEWFGGIDILINNAGFAPLIGIGRYDRHTIERAFEVNAIGPAMAIERVWPIMKKQGGGRIINVSTMGTKDPFPGFFVYAASKCAVDSFTRSIATEGKAWNIRSFAIAPGAVETRMLRTLFDESQIPSEATLSPLEVAQLIVECACGQRDDQNGETIRIARELPKDEPSRSVIVTSGANEPRPSTADLGANA